MKIEHSSLLIRLLLIGIILFFLCPAINDFRLLDALNNASIFMIRGQPEEAEVQLTGAQIMEPWRNLPWPDLAAVYLEQGKSARAIAILEPRASQNLLDASAWLTLARGYEQSGLPGRMEEALQALVRLNHTGPEIEMAYQMLVKLYRSQNRIEEALQSQTELVRLVSNNRDFKFEKVLLMLAVRPQEGLKDWESTTGKPAWLVQAGNQIAAAVQEKDEAVRMMKIGRAFGGMGNWDLAEYWLQQAADISPNYAEAWAFLAEARQQRGMDGKEQINRALDLAPDSPGVRALASLYFRRQHETARATVLLEKNIADQPAESTWYMELGSILAETGKMEEAVAAYQKAIELSPLDYARQAALARFCVQYEYRVSDLGLPAAEKAVALAADVPDAQDIYGLTLLAAGESEKANQAFSVALSLDPEYAPTWLHIGQAAISASDSSLAKEALLKAVKISGNSIEGQIARRLLEQYLMIKVDPFQN